MNFVRRAALALVLAIVPALGVVPYFAPAVAHADVVGVIVVRGNTRVEADTIRNYIAIKPGKPYSAADLDASVKELYGTGLFSDVNIVRSGNSLVVSVKENPIISTVTFKGNRKIKNEVLVGLTQLKARDIFTDAKLQGDIQRIKDYYNAQGRSEVTINPQVNPLPNDRVDVVFVINEGARTGIGAITFVGNHAFSDMRLRSVIISRQHNILSWLNKKDVYDEAKLAGDQEALRRFYMEHGYADFRVVSVDHEFNDAKGRYYITFTLDEGPRYTFSKIDIDSSIPGISSASLRPYLTTRPGSTFNATLVQKSIENISIQLSREGYAFAQVRPRGDRDYDHHSIAVTYLIDEGPRVYIERINITGNTKTRDYVIRRELDFAEGDPFNRVLIDRAQRKLNDLGYFKTVSITTDPGTAPDKVIVDIDVQDQPTGDFSIGAGYGTGGIIAEVGMNEKNFLGRGQQLSVNVGYGQTEQSYNVSFTDPYFLGSHISAGIDLFKTQTSQISYHPYDSDLIGGDVRFGLPITDDLTLGFKYLLSQNTISNVDTITYPQLCGGVPCISRYYPDGSELTSSVGYSLTYSTLDSLADPREGWNVMFNQDFAGAGGDARYVRSVIDARYYRELFPDADIVGLVRVTGGNITGLGQSVAASDNFFKGGETVRGFASLGYGPVDASTGVPVGGKNFWAATAEVQFPLPGVSRDFGLRGAVFADAGSLFGVDVPAGATVIDSNTIRSSVGASILWNSPIGLLRADFAGVLTKAATDQTQFFRFSAGRQF